MAADLAAAVEAHRRLVAAEQESTIWRGRRHTAILALRNDGWSIGKIAELLGVSKTRVAQLLR